MGAKQDLSGNIYGRLKVMGESIALNGRTKWLCKCDCGESVYVRADHLKYGTTSSCGCLWLERLKAKISTHGGARTPTYQIWEAMNQRCNNENSSSYKNYGGRGIKVCDR